MTTDNSDVILERMMSLHPKIIDLTLDRVWRLLAELGNPEQHLPPVIHVAGTNGKGSTIAMLRAGLEGDGAVCHAYTSPHLVRFHERIRLAGELISEDHLSQVLDECETANGSDPITYFEITTVAALLAFSRVPADFTLLEVGLGGRLDATNVVETPRMTIITPVSMDHEQYLGDTLTAIAGEKAGILKAGVTCVVGPQEPEALDVIEARADEIGAPLLAFGRHWDAYAERDRMVFQDETGLVDLPIPALIGRHQIENAGIAIATLRQIGRGDPERAVTDAVWPARLQRLRSGPIVDAPAAAEVWLDGGHNPAAGRMLADALDRMPPRPTWLVCGMLNTKDVAGYLAPLRNRIDRLVAVPIPDEPAALDPLDIAKAAQSLGVSAQVAGSAVEAAGHLSDNQPIRVVVGGSLYLAGQILKTHA